LELDFTSRIKNKSKIKFLYSKRPLKNSSISSGSSTLRITNYRVNFSWWRCRKFSQTRKFFRSKA